ncbi:MAG: tetratricopeptide repeat protein [Candidatus Omnitrophota bacterium]|jgi:tetratricopeptide (TPR) repeat protein
MFTIREKPKLRAAILACLILTIVFIAFLPSLKNGFVNWDDDIYVLRNPSIRVLSWVNIRTIFFSSFVANYQPLTILSYLFDYQFFKLNPFWYHGVNLLLHLLNCLLVFWLIYMLDGNMVIAALTSLLFGIHPLHVESVAWVSERKDVLYSFFFLGAAIFYLYYLRERKSIKYYYYALLFFFFSLLSKSMAVTLPGILLLFDYLRRRIPDKSIIIDKIPFFILSVIFGGIAIFSQHTNGSLIYEGSRSLLQVCSLVSHEITFYLTKIFLPLKLSCLYPYYGGSDFMYFFIFLTLIAGLIIVLFISRKHSRKLMFGSAFFLITLLPVLQLIPMGETIVSDRYVYISSIGIFYCLSAGLMWLYTKKIKYAYLKNSLLIIMFTGVMLWLIFLTWNRCKVWRDGISLWTDVLVNYPNATTAYNNRGKVFFARGEFEKAKSDFDHTISLDAQYYRRNKEKGYFFYNINLADMYNTAGKHAQAIELLEKAIQKDHAHMYDYYSVLAVSYAYAGNAAKAVQLLEEAIQSSLVDKTACYYNLGIIYRNNGSYDKAKKSYDEAIKLNPYFGGPYYGSAIIYSHFRDFEKAVVCFRKAIECEPDNEYLYNDLAAAYFSLGKPAKVIPLCKKAIRLNPSYAAPYVNLGIAYFSIGKYKEATASLVKATELNPNLMQAHSNLAEVYYYEKKYNLSIEHCEKAIALGDQESNKLLKLLKPYRERPNLN